MILKNQGGRLVEIDSEKEVQQLLATHQFTIPTPQEQEEYRKEKEYRYKLITGVIPHPEEQTPGNTDYEVYFSSVNESADGYGMSRQHIKSELQKLGVKISEEFKHQKIGFLYHSPYAVKRLENPIKVLFTMFESDKIPEDWDEYLRHVDKIIVPSEWCANVFRKRGFYPEVVPLGYNTKAFNYVERNDKEKTHEPFVFLHYNAFNLRKGFTEVAKAFIKEFQPDENVKMIFKTTLEHAPLPFPPSKYPNIEVQLGKVSDKELAKLCEKADCFVFPSRGEGFGITPLEAMATGCSAIVPNAHGITEYFNPEYMYEAKVREMCPAVYSRYKGRDVGKMVICDEDDLAAKMRYVVSHLEECRAKGKAASEYVKKYSYEETATKLKLIFDNLVKNKIKDSNSNQIKLEEI
ncbi:MAG TPA: glycosyltransferase family 4 protein [Vitreimonas sp.]|nr:glycosyltransferase family 4 protein [Vitreimonas sp.]